MKKHLFLNSTTAALVLTSHLESQAPGEYEFSSLPMDPAQLARIWSEPDSVFCVSLTSIGELRILEHVVQAAPGTLAECRGWPKLIVGGTALHCIDVDDLLASIPEVSYVVLGRGQEALLQILRERPETRVINGGGSGTIANDTLLPSLYPWHPLRPIPICRGHDICRWGRCRFCHHVNPADCRQVPVDAFCRQIAYYYKEYGWRHFYIYDNHLSPPDLAYIVEYMMAERIEPVFDVFGMRLVRSARELARVLRRSGMVRSIGWGLEIYSQRILDLYRKGIQLHNVLPILEEVAAAGVKSSLYLLIGLPGAEKADYEVTYDFCKKALANGIAAEAILNWFLLSQGIVDRMTCPEIRLRKKARYRVNEYFGESLELSDIRTSFIDFDTWDASRNAWIGRGESLIGYEDVYKPYLLSPGIRYDQRAFYMQTTVWKRIFNTSYFEWRQRRAAPIPPPKLARNKTNPNVWQFCGLS